MMRKCLVLFILWFIMLPSFAQELILNKVDLKEQLNIIDITQCKDGSIWLMTENQIMRYDGYDLHLKSSLPNPKERFTQLAHLRDEVYVGSNVGSVYKYKGDSLVKIAEVNGRVTDMVSLNDREYLISSNGGGIYKYDVTNGACESIHSIDQMKRTNDIQPVKEEIYFATDRGLYRSNVAMSQINAVSQVGNKIIDHLQYDGKSTLWLSEFQNHLHSMDIHSEVIHSFSLKNKSRINHILLTNNRLFVSTNDGLYHLETISNTSLSSTAIPQFVKNNNDPTTTSYGDDEGNLWIGTNDGLIRSSMLFSSINLSIQGNTQALICQNDNIYIGTNEGLFVMKKDNKDSVMQLNDDNITCLDANPNTIAIGTYANGLQIMNVSDNDNKTISQLKYPFKNSVLALKFISNTKLIVATLTGVKIMVKNSDRWEIQEELSALDNYYILSIYNSKEGKLWFGTDKKGLISYENGQLTKYDTTRTGEAIKSVYSILEGTSGNIWAASNALGLIKQSNAGFTIVANEASENRIQDLGPFTSIAMMNDSLMLMIGVYNVSIYNILDKTITVYNEALQLKPKESFLNNYCKPFEKIIFEHQGKLYQVNQQNGLRTQPLTTLSDVRVNLKKIDTTEVVFKESQNNFSFHYNGILLRKPSEVSYAYKLDGIDNAWRFTKDRSVTYPQLSPGQYKFVVRPTDLLQNEDNPISYSFTIKKAFYKTWWFISICSMLALWMVLFLIRKNRKDKELKDQLILQKTETQLSNLKSQLNPHFLFNSFNTVIGLIEEDKERSIEYIQKLTDFFRLVLETNERELVSIDVELKLLESYNHLLKERFPKGLFFKINRPFTPSVIPPLSMQMLVENAVKHNVVSSSVPLTITVEEKEGFIIVSNNLNSKKISEPSFGIGLSNLKSRYQLLTKKNIIINKQNDHMIVKLPLILHQN